ncbi:radical SAM/SPASM domain-containing protein [Bradyrhizobium sp. Pha-3]|uniref:radical SAM/SPASM domain-containing protein n=1 Tax=Bradyrhizobium sp. Pha-3 TaxID=208375 RepID=UPI0035D3FDCC
MLATALRRLMFPARFSSPPAIVEAEMLVRARISASSGDPKETEKNRIKLITASLVEAGASSVEVAWPNGSNVVHSTGLDRAKEFVDIACTSGDLHVTSSHVKRLVAAALESKSNVRFDFEKAMFVYSMGLAFDVSARYSGGDAVPSEKLLPVTDDDVLDAYRVFADTHLPNTVILELNSTCNFKCGYCPFHGDDQTDPRYLGKAKATEMSLENFEKIVKQIAAWPRKYSEHVVTIAPFSRGEFFLSHDWKRALEIIHEAGLRSYVCSNASILSTEILDTVMKDGLLDHLTISLDATTKEENYRTRRNTKFNKIIANIEHASQLRKNGSPTFLQLNCTITETNKDSIDEYTRGWIDKVDIMLIGPTHVLNRATKHVTYDYQYSTSGPDHGVESHEVPCSFLFQTLEIYSNGNISLCAACGSERIPIGNAFDEEDIFAVRSRSKLFNNVRNVFISGQGNNGHPYCANCLMYKGHFARTEKRDGAHYRFDHSSWIVQNTK